MKLFVFLSLLHFLPQWVTPMNPSDMNPLNTMFTKNLRDAGITVYEKDIKNAQAAHILKVDPVKLEGYDSLSLCRIKYQNEVGLTKPWEGSFSGKIPEDFANPPPESLLVAPEVRIGKKEYIAVLIKMKLQLGKETVSFPSGKLEKTGFDVKKRAIEILEAETGLGSSVDHKISFPSEETLEPSAADPGMSNTRLLMTRVQVELPEDAPELARILRPGVILLPKDENLSKGVKILEEEYMHEAHLMGYLQGVMDVQEQLKREKH